MSVADAFEEAWSISKRKTPWCPYCNGNLTLASGEWNNKKCMSCNRWVKPYYSTNPNSYDAQRRWWGT